MMFGQARSRSVLMGLDNHMITGTVPALRSREQASPERDMTSHHATRPTNRTDLEHAMPLGSAQGQDSQFRFFLEVAQVSYVVGRPSPNRCTAPSIDGLFCQALTKA